MLTINCLRLSLPASFADRGPQIARMLAEELAALPLASSVNIERLKAPPVTVSRELGLLAAGSPPGLNGIAERGLRRQLLGRA